MGVVAVKKPFKAGDLIEVLSQQGERLARGIAQLDSANVQLVLQKKTAQVRSILGEDSPEEVIHKNDLVVF